jgi:hypothetical protein
MPNWNDNVSNARSREKRKKILIIGGVAAGTSAAARLDGLIPKQI